jgi:3-deoxy-manno-octulosonate cytidylyltransferase (CMP-KDO synthetase)
VSFNVVIPARFASSRLPGKPLADIHGKPMIARVVERAQMSDAKRVIVATDDQIIVSALSDMDCEVILTSKEHRSGTDRIAEVIDKIELADDEIVINVQGDEPLLPPENINQTARMLVERPDVNISTLCVQIYESEDVFDPNVVKTLMDKKGVSLYYSRAPVPWYRGRFDGSQELTEDELRAYFRHVGIYGYRAGLIRQFVKWPMSSMEKLESLEQLRAMENGEIILCQVAEVEPPHGVDTPADLEKIRAYMANNGENL